MPKLSKDVNGVYQANRLGIKLLETWMSTAWPHC